MADAIADDETKTEGAKDPAAEQAALETRVDEELAKDGIDVPKPKEEKTDGSDKSTDSDGSSDTSKGDEETSTEIDTTEDTEDTDETTDPDTTEADTESTTELDQKPSNEEFFFEVEDAEGKSYKITKIEDLPADFEPKNNRQVMEIIAEANKLETRIADKQVADAKAEDEAILTAARTEIQKSWEGDIQALVDEKLLDKPKLASNDPKYADDPAVKKTDAVFKFINDTNEVRKKDGNPNLLTSFKDAFELMELRDLKAKQADEAKNEGDLAKKKAGVIGTNASATQDTPVYRAGSYRDIDDVPI